MPSGQQNPSKYSPFAQTFISYGSYHHNLVNKIIHIFCIPTITATLYAMLSYIPFKFHIAGYEINSAHIFFLLSMAYYMTISVGAAAIMTVAIGVGYFLWNLAFQGKQPHQMRNWIIAINVVAWVLQFIGHGVFQKRKPALMDNILQVFSAPLFVLIQLSDLIGLRTKDMEEWKGQIQKNVKQFHSKSIDAKAAVKTQ